MLYSALLTSTGLFFWYTPPMRKLILAIALVAGCSGAPIPIPDVTDTDLCGEAEVNLERMQCKDRAGDPMWVNRRGERFRDICTKAQEEGGIFLNPRCIMEAKTCEEAKACPSKGE